MEIRNLGSVLIWTTCHRPWAKPMPVRPALLDAGNPVFVPVLGTPVVAVDTAAFDSMEGPALEIDRRARAREGHFPDFRWPSVGQLTNAVGLLLDVHHARLRHGRHSLATPLPTATFTHF